MRLRDPDAFKLTFSSSQPQAGGLATSLDERDGAFR